MDSDFVGKKFGDWTVLRFSHTDQYRNHYWVCRCTCGETNPVRQGNLTRGTSTRFRRKWQGVLDSYDRPAFGEGTDTPGRPPADG